MIDLWQAVVLGIVQGITEWLPVSSSGHLVIIQQLFQNIQEPVTLDLFLHIGSLFVVLFVFFDEIKKIVLSFFVKKYREYRKLAYFVIIGTIPTALIGYFFKDLFESAFSSLLAVGISLLVTGTFLFFCERFQKKKKLTLGSALTIGFVQGLAITPGISRSGSTIASALFLGIDKKEAVRFSFLLFIPAIAGATVLHFKDMTAGSIEWLPIIVGMAVSVVVGYLALKLLILVVDKKRLHYFSYYCWLVGLLAIVLSFKF
jgi:undecaprenyl-diphosphatase